MTYLKNSFVNNNQPDIIPNVISTDGWYGGVGKGNSLIYVQALVLWLWHWYATYVVCPVLAVRTPFCLCWYWFTRSHSFSVRIASSDNCSENKQNQVEGFHVCFIPYILSQAIGYGEVCICAGRFDSKSDSLVCCLVADMIMTLQSLLMLDNTPQKRNCGRSRGLDVGYCKKQGFIIPFILITLSWN